MERHVKPGPLEIDPDERALVVNYEIEATVLGQNREVVRQESRSHRRLIRRARPAWPGGWA